MAIERLKTGNSQLDEILHGGFPINTINVVMGAPGTGKTILAEQLVFANATAGRARSLPDDSLGTARQIYSARTELRRSSTLQTSAKRSSMKIWERWSANAA